NVEAGNTHDVDDDVRPCEPGREQRQQRLTAREHARVGAFAREHVVRFGQAFRAHVIEARGLHGTSPREESIKAESFAGVSGRSSAATPSASATALAMHTGVDMQLPSPTPLAPSGVNGDGDCVWRMSGAGTSVAVGNK